MACLQCWSPGGHLARWVVCSLLGRALLVSRNGWSGGHGMLTGIGPVWHRRQRRVSASCADWICVRYWAGWNGFFLCIALFSSFFLSSWVISRYVRRRDAGLEGSPCSPHFWMCAWRRRRILWACVYAHVARWVASFGVVLFAVFVIICLKWFHWSGALSVAKRF